MVEDWEKYRDCVCSREIEHHAKANSDAAEREKKGEYALCCSYVGHWTDIGVTSDSGKLLNHGDLWDFCTQYKYMQKLSNVMNYDGVCLVGYDAKKMERCLELGCDWGHCWPVFESCFEKVYGIEVVDWSAKLGIEKGRNITHGVMECIPYEDNYFDVVLSNHVLEHGISADVVLNEVYRVTKPGGYSIHTLPCRMDKVNIDEESDKNIHQTLLNYEQWLEVFLASGFIVERDFFGWNHNQEDWTVIARKLL